MSLESVQAIVQIVSSVAGIGAAFWALFVYRSNSRRERARWAESLYSRFYEKAELKDIRERLDCEPGDEAGDAAVADLVAEEPAELTDYLNFFEFVAYLQSSKQLSETDVQALFSYYLECLRKHKTVAAYIEDPKKGFEHLRNTLFHA
jgi:uncharacterized membrane protein YwzB